MLAVVGVLVVGAQLARAEAGAGTNPAPAPPQHPTHSQPYPSGTSVATDSLHR